VKSDGTVAAWGWNAYGQCDVPIGLNGVKAVAAGTMHSLALKHDGTIIAWSVQGITNAANPSSDFGQCTVPTGCANAVAIGAAGFRSMALLAYPPLAIQSGPRSQTAYAGSTADFSAHATGFPLPWYLWFANGTGPVGCGTNSRLHLTSLQIADSGSYTVVVTNLFGSDTSAPALLNVIAPVEQNSTPTLRLAGEPGALLHLEFATTLAPVADWTPLDSVSLTGASQFYFDLSPTLAQRFYRVWQTGSPGIVPSLGLDFVSDLTLRGSLADTFRVDFINQYGPTDAWVNLGSVTLTNATQQYFDLTSIRQPPRLYRVVPIP
jgi:hypothetical protein